MVITAGAQTNTNRLFAVPYYYFTNTNAMVFMDSRGKQGITTNNNNGTNWFLVSGSPSNPPTWQYKSLSNIDGNISASRVFGGLPGGITTNIDFTRAISGFTNWLCFTNGLLMNVVSNAP